MRRLFESGPCGAVMKGEKVGLWPTLLPLRLLLLGVIFLCLSSVVVSDEQKAKRFAFDIPSQTADVSLIDFADTVNVTLVVPFEKVRNIKTPELKGFFTLKEGLTQLLSKTSLAADISGTQLTILTKRDVGGDTRVKISNNIKLVAATVVLSSSVNAQSELEEVVVTATTGSRIQTNLTSSQPISAITAEDFINSGALTAADALNQLPQLGDSLEGGSSINSLNSGFGVGTQTVNLRNLGSNRTLVVVNGRRHVGGDVGTSSVDLNSIPSGLIERIDVVTGASSAVYGADAVTGVVNIVLKEDFEGTKIGTRYGVSSEGDANEFGLDFTHGGVYKNGDYVFALEYSQQDPIFGADRSFAQNDGSAATGLSDPANGSGVNPGGLFSSANAGGNGGFDSNGDFVSPFSERFQRVPFRSLQNESDRLVVSGRASYDFSESSEFFAEVTYANNTSTVQFDPQLAIFSDAGFATAGTAGFRFPTAPTVTTGGDDLRAITRRFSEFGPRTAEIDRDLFRTTFGLKGTIGESDYEIYYQYGRVESDQTDFDTIDKFRLVTAIDPVACAATAGCDFVDIYGRNSIDPQSLAFVSDDLVSNSESEQQVISAYLTGELFNIGNKDASYVIGAEYRDEEASINPNEALIAVDNPLNPGVGQLVGLRGTRTFFGATNGGYDVAEVFGELLFPISDAFNIGASARISDYSTVGVESTYGFKANYDVTEQLSFRASVGSATRAPNINELFSPDSVSTTGISDPCDTLADDNTALTAAAGCSAFGATFNPSDLDQQIRGVSGGNPDLDSETADTFTFGAILSLGEATTITLDYYSIDLEDVLAASFSAQATLDRCIATGEDFFCNNISRDATTNFVTSIRSEQVNLAEESVEGVDLSFRHSWAIKDGFLDLSVNYAHLLDHSRRVNDTVAEEDLVGRVDNIEDKVNLTLAYNNTNWNIGLTARYLASAQQSLTADPLIATGNAIGSQLYLDLNGGFNVSEKIRVTFGVENLSDEASPVVTQLFENNGSADTTSAGIYDVRGRFMYFNASYNF